MIFKREGLFSMKNLIAIFLILPFAFCLLPSPVAAHTFHTSLTRIDYNSEEKTTAITIQCFAHDLETALGKRAGTRVNREKSKEAGQLILGFLGERFALKNKSGETKTLNFVGKEQSADAVWLYLETPMPEGLSGATLENTIFFDLANDQVNLVTCRFDGKKNDFAFNPNDKPKVLIEENAATKKK